MTQGSVRRVVLRSVLKLMGFVAFLFVAYVGFVSLFSPGSARLDTVRTVKLQDLSPGEVLWLEWGGRRVVVLHRTPEMLGEIRRLDAELKSPDRLWSNQPGTADPVTRSVKPEYFVALAYGTELGCELDFVPYRAEEPGDWRGGFVDRCRGSRYDFAGRVFKSDSAPRNLDVPDYYFATPERLVLGRE